MLVAGNVSQFKNGWVTFKSNATDNEYDFYIGTEDKIKKNSEVRIYLEGRHIKHVWINKKKYR